MFISEGLVVDTYIEALMNELKIYPIFQVSGRILPQLSSIAWPPISCDIVSQLENNDTILFGIRESN